MKTVVCKDIGVDCNNVISADTEKELIQKAKLHIQHTHEKYWEKKMKNISNEEMLDEIKPHIRES